MYIYFVIYAFVTVLYLGEPRVVLSDPDLIKHVAVTNSENYDRAPILQFLIPSIGNGLFSSILGKIMLINVK